MTNTSFTTSYETFCMNMQEEVKKRSKEGSKVRLQTVRKLNGVILQGITITDEHRSIMPTIYLDKFFTMYKKGQSMEEVATLFMEEYEEAEVEAGFDIQFFSDYEKVKPHLYFRLLHCELNKELLEQVPYQKYLDLAIVCYCDIRGGCIPHGSILIKKDHLVMWKVSEEQLIKDSMKNMESLYPADLMNMAVLLKELYIDPVSLLSLNFPMYVLTNKERLNGAASLLYEGQLEKLAKILGEDYYVLPSSIHEVIIVPKSKVVDEEELSHTVNEINQEHLQREEVLSNHAYYYDGLKEELVCLPLIPKQKD